MKFLAAIGIGITNQRRAELVRLMRAALDTPVLMVEETMPVHSRSEEAAMRAIAAGILRLVTGEETHRIHELMAVWHMPLR